MGPRTDRERRRQPDPRRAVVTLLAFGVVLAVPALAARVEGAISRIAAAPRRRDGEGLWSGLVLGAGLGFVHAPCVGPILAGVITTSAAQHLSVARAEAGRRPAAPEGDLGAVEPSRGTATAETYLGAQRAVTTATLDPAERLATPVVDGDYGPGAHDFGAVPAVARDEVAFGAAGVSAVAFTFG